MSVTDTGFNPTGSNSVHAIKSKVLELEQVILDCSPEGRRRSVALTHLEAASMFAVKAIFSD
jgi:glyceraldehyde-3-phosphate dehydrogenase/erythrose-4-phosphate dehydrogenase